MNLLGNTPFNVNTKGRVTSKPFYLTAMILLGAAALAVVLLSIAQIGQGSVAAQSQVPANYDSDGDGLIEITTLEQLNAIRWDLSGDGTVTNDASTTEVDEAAEYANAFSEVDAGDVCPSGSTCTGYELMADLDFDENGDGEISQTGDPTYWNDGAGWEPIGTLSSPFEATFDGNGYTISSLFINRGDTDAVGLFGVLFSTSGVIRQVGLENADVSGRDRTGALVGSLNGQIISSYATGTVKGRDQVGGLVGESFGGDVNASYASATVRGRDKVGGLVGYVPDGRRVNLTAVYATGAVSGTDKVGGLVGDLSDDGTVTAAYATGEVRGFGSMVGGLIGAAAGGATITASYYDTDTSGRIGGTGPQSTTGLQSPTEANGIYSTWDDAPWHFGTNSQYPVLNTDFNGDGTGTWQEFGFQVRDGLALRQTNTSLTAPAFSWTAPTLPPQWSSPAITYRVYRDRVPVVGSQAGTTHSDTGLTEGPVYAYQVAALLDGVELRRGNLVFIGDYANAEGLISIANLEQLNAIRWDPDGNGVAIDGKQAEYAAAFPYGGDPVCPNGRDCIGYQLLNDLDFDTGTPGVREDDIYYNDGAGWVPIGDSKDKYNAKFRGNGNIIANLHIKRDDSDNRDHAEHTGLFGAVGADFAIDSKAVIEQVGLENANVSGRDLTGALVGSNFNGTISRSYVTGTVSGHDSDKVGGLVGGSHGGEVSHSYARATVSGSDKVGGLVGYAPGDRTRRVTITAVYANGMVSGGDKVGGLVGDLSDFVTVTFAYATGPVTGTGEKVGGLIGAATDGAIITESYYDTNTTGRTGGTRPRPQSTTALQSPTGATGIYAGWNVAHWDFGTSTQYPALIVDFDGKDGPSWQEFWVTGVPSAADSIVDQTVYPGSDKTIDLKSHFSGDDRLTYTANSPRPDLVAVAVDGSMLTITGVALGETAIIITAKNIDPDPLEATQAFIAAVKVNPNIDGDSLINVANLEQLNAIRWDLDGDGTADEVANAAAFSRAFPSLNPDAHCGPDGCDGYELMNDLDFTQAGSYAANAVNSDWIDDTNVDTDAGWEPIGTLSSPFEATFDGNGYTISNLFINRGDTDAVGLFGVLFSTSGVIRQVGLENVDVSGRDRTGALVGSLNGQIFSSYATGTVKGRDQVGGLVGESFGGDVNASYASATVRGRDKVGGLVGYVPDDRRVNLTAVYATGAVRGDGNKVGGLVGDLSDDGTVTAAYATGEVRGFGSMVGGLIGAAADGATITASYYDTDTSGRIGGTGPQSTTALQTPDTRDPYTGIYADWDNIDLNSNGKADMEDTNDFWDFGTASQYPPLKTDFDGKDGPSWQEFGFQVRDGLALRQTNTSLSAPAFSWTAPTLPPQWSSPAITYRVYRDRVPVVGSQSGTTHSDTGLTEGPVYAYQVAALLDGVELRRGNLVFIGDYANAEGFISIANLEQLNAIRWDPDGNGVAIDGKQADYAAAFPYGGDPVCPADVDGGCIGYQLLNDLDFDTGTAGVREDDIYYNEGAGWEPIGDEEVPFIGTFAGDGHTISNLYVHSDANDVGLFGRLEGRGMITGLRLVDVNVTSFGAPGENQGAGGLVGKNFGRINNSFVTGHITRQGNSASSGTGVVGHLGRVTNVGGLAGENDGGVITNSRTAMTVSGDDIGDDVVNIGGLVGQNTRGQIISSYATGKVIGDGDDYSSIAMGGLVGDNTGGITTSYATVVISGIGDNVGGLAGRNSGTFRGAIITASYAGGEIHSDGGSDIGGLVGRNEATITASYATVVISGIGDNVGGLVGLHTFGTITASYWDTDISGIPVADGETRGKTNADLISPTNYAGIYANWNLDLDNSDRDNDPSTGGDNPWNFGTSSQYPVLNVEDFDGDGMDGGWQEFGYQVRERPDLTGELTEGDTVAQMSWTEVSTDQWMPPPIIEYALYRLEGDSPWAMRGELTTETKQPDSGLNPTSKYSYQVRVLVNRVPTRVSNTVELSGRDFMDRDGNGLIEVSNLAQLNAIQFDPDGNGTPSLEGTSAYNEAFDVTQKVPCSGPCRGYELDGDLNFDQNGDGKITDADAAYWNDGAGWEPIDYNAVFEGSGHTISNLYINSPKQEPVGLFRRLGSGGLINHLGLAGVDITNSGVSSSVGGLVGHNDGGTIVGSHVIGQVTAYGGESAVGGLVGLTDAGRIIASYAIGSVSAFGDSGGGLVGGNAGGIIAGSYAATSVLERADAKGGLVGKIDGGTIIAAYATGRAEAGGGLVGENLGGTIIAAYSTGVANGGLVATNSTSVTNGISSYWDSRTSRTFSSAGGTRKTTAQLQGPTGYTGIYANWNVDIDDADGDGDPFTGGDNPWIFGGSGDYPTLNLPGLRVLPGGERAVLAEFYEATQGSKWTSSDNWLSDEPISSWKGVHTNVSGRVTRLNLRGNNLVGTIPVSLGNLAELEILDLGVNSLKGVIPAHLGNLTSLKVLYLDRNDLKTELPDVAVEGGGLSGNIPAQLGRLTNLQVLDLGHNNLGGPVPEELGNLQTLSYLGLLNNPLSGPLPSSFTNLTRLRSLNLRNTSLCAPPSLRQWSSGLESFTGPYC